MNILIKLMSIVSLVIAPTLASIYSTGEGTASHPRHVEKTTGIHHAPVSKKSSVTMR
jgi:hypothetical protein